METMYSHIHSQSLHIPTIYTMEMQYQYHIWLLRIYIIGHMQWLVRFLCKCIFSLHIMLILYTYIYIYTIIIYNITIYHNYVISSSWLLLKSWYNVIVFCDSVCPHTYDNVRYVCVMKSRGYHYYVDVIVHHEKSVYHFCWNSYDNNITITTHNRSMLHWLYALHGYIYI